MNTGWRILFPVIISAGFVFGFAGLIVPGQSAILEQPVPGHLQYQRLHIFLFNLVAGGTILLWFTEGKREFSLRTMAYLVLALAFSLAAFLDHYASAILLAVCLAVIVESIRISRFSFFPIDFFSPAATVARKFHHAAVLCLSLALLISAAIMTDRQYLHLFPRLNLLLDEFFLGFSFPLSLITFSVMFALFDTKTHGLIRWLGEFTFWVVTVGVIVFFVFIITKIVIGELACALILLADVIVIFVLFKRNAQQLEKTQFLDSGMLFLIATGVTGVVILIWHLDWHQNPAELNLLLQIHAYLSLYGWNLSGLAVVVRHSEFPSRMHGVEVIVLHWATIAVLAPLGTIYPVFACLALPAFAILIAQMLFSRGHGHVAERTHGGPIVASQVWPHAEGREG